MSIPRSEHPDWRSRQSPAATSPAAQSAIPPIPWRGGRGLPVIGITADLIEAADGGSAGPVTPARLTCAMAYCRAVAAAGGTPIVLPPIVPLAAEHARRMDGIILTGGDDPRTEPFGEPTHPAARLVHPDRQAYETALLQALERTPDTPVLGICLGMQMMALLAGGKLNQHLPDDVPTAAAHAGNATHTVRSTIENLLPPQGAVTSSHHQAVRDPGRLRTLATAEDGIIEAIDDPSRRFYLGVQWHPERTADPAWGVGLFARLIEAARGR